MTDRLSRRPVSMDRDSTVKKSARLIRGNVRSSSASLMGMFFHQVRRIGDQNLEVL
jgi:hypothetical protein